MQPGFPTFLPPCDLRPGTVQGKLYMFVCINRGGIGRRNVSLDPKPVVCEVNDGSINADRAGVEERGPETEPRCTENELPAGVVGSTVKKHRHRRRRSWMSGSAGPGHDM